MKSRVRLSLVSLFLAFLSSAPDQSLAAELYGIKFDDKITVSEKPLVLNGLGLRSVTRFGLKIKVYVIGLYLPKKMSSVEEILKSEGPKVYKMVFHRNVDKEDLIKGWKAAYDLNCGTDCKKYQSKISEFNALMSDIRAYKAITVTVHKSKVTIDSEGRQPKSASIEDENFARIVEKIWLGVPPNEELKKGILGL